MVLNMMPPPDGSGGAYDGGVKRHTVMKFILKKPQRPKSFIFCAAFLHETLLILN